MPTDCLIDTDMAIDDWMAVAYLLQCPEVRVRAITVAATGEAHAGPGVRNALRLVALNPSQKVEVAAGSTEPLRGHHRFPLILRLIMDFRFFVSFPQSRQQPSGETAVALLKRVIESSADQVMIVALGPLTNLAELLTEHPALASRISMICMMGGAVNVPGNIAEINNKIDNPYAEWNLYIDPYAADVVFQSGVPVTLVPLDATNQVPLTPQYLTRLENEAKTPAAQFVVRAIRRISRLLSGDRKFYFWDPLAAVVATHPEVATYEQRHLRVIHEEGREAGRVIEDSESCEIRVCQQVNAAAFEELFLKTLNGQAT